MDKDDPLTDCATLAGDILANTDLNMVPTNFLTTASDGSQASVTIMYTMAMASTDCGARTPAANTA